VHIPGLTTGCTYPGIARGRHIHPGIARGEAYTPGYGQRERYTTRVWTTGEIHHPGIAQVEHTHPGIAQVGIPTRVSNGHTPPGYRTDIHHPGMYLRTMVGIVHPGYVPWWVYVHPGYIHPYHTLGIPALPHTRVHVQQRGAAGYVPDDEALGSNLEINVRKVPLCALWSSRVWRKSEASAQSCSALPGVKR